MLARRVVLRVRCPGPLDSCSPAHARCVLLWVRYPGPRGYFSRACTLRVMCCVCGVLGHLAPVRRCARSVCCAVCAMSLATWLLFFDVLARCLVLRVWCPGPLGTCAWVCPLGVWCCVCGVLGHLAPVHCCARAAGCVACAVSWVTWLLFTGVHARCVALRVWCPGPLRSCSAVCSLGVLCCACGVLDQSAPVYRRARSVRCVACVESWATWLLFTSVLTWRVVLHVRCPWPFGSCSSPCSPDPLCCVCGVLDHVAPVHGCARSVCCAVCAVSRATWLLFTGVLARCVVLLCGVLGHLAPVRGCACSVCVVVCAVSLASGLLFTGAPAPCVVLCVWCPGPLGSCARVCPLGVLCCVCRVLGHWAPVHQCARSVRGVVCVVSWATWLLFTSVHAPCVVLCVQCPEPLGSCSPVCSPGALCCCVVSWATWLLCAGVPARCVVLRVPCPWPLGCCSPVRPLCASCCLCGVLGHLAPVHRCARPVRCVACVVSWDTWLLCAGVPARRVVLRVRCAGPHGSCSPCARPVHCVACSGVLGHLAPVHRCARSVCCAVCAMS